MTDFSTLTESEQAQELEALKHRADQLGVQYSNQIGYETLRERVKEAILKEREENNKEAAKEIKVNNVVQLSKRKEAEKLVRVIVTCMDPSKKAYDGEIFTVGNAEVGTLRKYIQFGVPWHIPKIMFDTLKEKKFRATIKRKTTAGREYNENKQMNAYAIQELEPLTEKEIKQLAQRQAMAQGEDVENF